MNEELGLSSLTVKTWLNTSSSETIDTLQGKVVVVFAFQMLCPGCVQYSLPQAKRVYSLLDEAKVKVIGLHSVFEHHSANTDDILKAFIFENRIGFPIGIDMPSNNQSPLPKTMTAFNMEGTPTLLLFDKQGRLRKQKFGHEDDLKLGIEIMSLIAENEY